MAVGDGGVRVEVLMLPRLQRYRRDAGRYRPVLHLGVSWCLLVSLVLEASAKFQVSGLCSCELVASVAARDGVVGEMRACVTMGGARCEVLEARVLMQLPMLAGVMTATAIDDGMRLMVAQERAIGKPSSGAECGKQGFFFLRHRGEAPKCASNLEARRPHNLEPARPFARSAGLPPVERPTRSSGQRAPQDDRRRATPREAGQDRAVQQHEHQRPQRPRVVWSMPLLAEKPEGTMPEPAG